MASQILHTDSVCQCGATLVDGHRCQTVSPRCLSRSQPNKLTDHRDAERWPSCRLAGTMFLVGLTGGIGSGKSTVSAMLCQLGCPVIDADLIAREVVLPGRAAHTLIVQHFGTEILLPTGEINREMLGSLIFSNPEKCRLLNSITHPEIRKAMLWQIFKYFLLGHRYVILDVPLLFETRGLTRFLKHIVVVYSDPDTQLSRLMKRDGITRAQAEQRIAAQLPLKDKRRLADHVIENSGGRDNTQRQVLCLHAKLERSWDFLALRAVVLAMVTGLGGLLVLLVKQMAH
ncbi:DCAKD protein, partial [Polypterus senegalus]